MNTLPPEILHEIAHNLDPHSLKNTSEVDKCWRSIATKPVFRSIRLRTSISVAAALFNILGRRGLCKLVEELTLVEERLPGVYRNVDFDYI